MRVLLVENSVQAHCKAKHGPQAESNRNHEASACLSSLGERWCDFGCTGYASVRRSLPCRRCRVELAGGGPLRGISSPKRLARWAVLISRVCNVARRPAQRWPPPVASWRRCGLRSAGAAHPTALVGPRDRLLPRCACVCLAGRCWPATLKSTRPVSDRVRLHGSRLWNWHAEQAVWDWPCWDAIHPHHRAAAFALPHAKCSEQ